MADERDAAVEMIEGPTPNGHHHAVAYYRDDDGNPCPKSRATRVEVHENDESGEPVQRTHAEIGGRP